MSLFEHPPGWSPKFPTRKRQPGSRNGRGSKWITPKRRLEIYERDGWKCFWCSRCLRDVQPRFRTLDHIWPRHRGGSHDSNNLVMACVSCNSTRSNYRPSQEWLR